MLLKRDALKKRCEEVYHSFIPISILHVIYTSIFGFSVCIASYSNRSRTCQYFPDAGGVDILHTEYETRRCEHPCKYIV